MSAVVPTADAPSARRRARRGWRVPPLIALCFVVIGAILVCAITGTALAPHPPSAQDLDLGVQGPIDGYLLGTDDSGRDILSRVIAGARAAVIGPLLIALGAATIGTLLGLLAGFRGGWTETAIMRGVDLVYALPALLVAIVLLGVIGGGYYAAVLVLVFLSSTIDIRVVRGATLEQRTLPYVDAARTIGLGSWRIMLRHIWPNVMPLVVSTAFLNFAYGLVALSALSFLGLGAGPGEADWGRMLADNLSLIEDAPLAALAPGLMLVATAVSVNLVGDWLQELLSDRGRAR